MGHMQHARQIQLLHFPYRIVAMGTERRHIDIYVTLLWRQEIKEMLFVEIYFGKEETHISSAIVLTDICSTATSGSIVGNGNYTTET